MNTQTSSRGSAPVGLLADLPPVEAGAVLYLRLWSDGPAAQAQVWRDFSDLLGPIQGRQALQSFEQLFDFCARHGRRPLMRHRVSCKCLGADESCFAHFIAATAEGANEDAILMAMLIVHPDMAANLVAIASQFGLALKHMTSGLRTAANIPTFSPTLH